VAHPAEAGLHHVEADLLVALMKEETHQRIEAKALAVLCLRVQLRNPRESLKTFSLVVLLLLLATLRLRVSCLIKPLSIKIKSKKKQKRRSLLNLRTKDQHLLLVCIKMRMTRML
jgi:hypothetical protein